MLPEPGGPSLIASNTSIIRWDGATWLPLTSSTPNSSTIEVYDNGSGPRLYTGGSFTTIGSFSVNNIAMWNGTSWSRLGTGIATNGVGAAVTDMEVHDFGAGPSLYVGGHFTSTGSGPANRIARWNGSTWSALGTGLNRGPNTLHGVSAGSLAGLYAGGTMTNAGGATVKGIARWSGSAWSDVGGGVSDANLNEGEVTAIHRHLSGESESLIVGGVFVRAGNVPARNIAQWNGTSWSAMGSGLNSRVADITSFDQGNGPEVFVTGAFTRTLEKTTTGIPEHNGEGWSTTPPGAPVVPQDFARFNSPAGPAIALRSGSGVYSYDGSTFSLLGGTPNGSVFSLAAIGGSVYASGSFTSIGAAQVYAQGMWNGTSWSQMRHEVDVQATRFVHDSGAGPELFAHGSFAESSYTVREVAQQVGSEWHSVGGGVPTGSEVNAVVQWNSPAGPRAVIGGLFNTAGGVTVANIAQWNGSAWSALAQGVNGRVKSLAVFPSLGGDQLIAAGSFTSMNGLPGTFNNIARWDGMAWQPLGTGLNAAVEKVIVFDDGNGPKLIAAGDFTTAGGSPANYIAAWDGSAWAPLGDGLAGGRAYRLCVSTVAGAPQLYVGGTFLGAGGVSANRMAAWNGTAWMTVAPPPFLRDVLAFAEADVGAGPRLFVCGVLSGSGTPQGFYSFDGSAWSTLPFGGYDPVCRMLMMDPDGPGPFPVGLNIVSEFIQFGPTEWRQWNGTSLVSGPYKDSSPRDACQVDLGSGPTWWLVGESRIDIQPCKALARRVGDRWEQFGNIAGGDVRRAFSLFDGTSHRLFIVGNFYIGVQQRYGLFMWDGAGWTSMNANMSSNEHANQVTGMAYFDEDGAGPNPPRLYASGAFDLSGYSPGTRRGLVRWNGSSWDVVGGGCTPPTAIGIADPDGNGPAEPVLLVGGVSSIGPSDTPIPVDQFVGWNGENWVRLKGSAEAPSAITTVEGPSGPITFITGVSNFDFTTLNGIARWDGTDWAPLGYGTQGGAGPMLKSPITGDNAMLVGGSFTYVTRASDASNQTVNGLGKWSSVGPLPQVTVPASVQAVVGGTVSVAGIVSGSGTLSMQWRKNGVDIANDARVSGAQSATLQIIGIEPADAASYSLRVVGDCGTNLSSNVVLGVRCPADVSNGMGTPSADGNVDINDLLFFLASFEAGSPLGADVDDGTGSGSPDGAVDVSDLLFFLARFEGGC